MTEELNIPEKVKPSYKGFIIAFWVVFLIGIGSVYYFFNAIANDELLGKLPSFQQLENPNTSLATQLLSSDGKQLGTIFKENRALAEYKELSPYIIEALVSTEDERYYDHSGIDGKSLARAV